MSLKEERAHYCTFMLEDGCFESHTQKFRDINMLRWEVTSVLFSYLNDRLIENQEKNPNFFYDFRHPNVNMLLITNDENKINEISGFINYLLKDDQLMKIFSLAEKDGDFDSRMFNGQLDKVLAAFQLDRTLSNHNNTKRKAKI